MGFGKVIVVSVAMWLCMGLGGGESVMGLRIQGCLSHFVGLKTHTPLHCKHA
ncbi:hypothetical protein AAZV13_14G091200 [Glycine max]